MVKLLKWIGGIVFLGVILGCLLVIFFLDSIVKDKIISGVSEASDGFYKIEIKEVDTRFWTGAIKMDEVWLTPDTSYFHKTKNKDSIYAIPNVKFYLDTVTVAKIDWIRYLLDNEELIIGDVWISQPKLYVKSRIKNNSNINEGNKNFLDFLPGIIAAFTGSLKIQSIAIKNGTMDVVLFTPSGVMYQQTSEVDISLDKITIDTFSVKKTLFSESVNFNLRNYKLTSSDGLYYIGIGKIHGQVNDSLLQIYDFHLKKRDTASNKYKDEFFIKIPSTENRGVNFASLFREKKIGFRKMEIRNPEVRLISSDALVNKKSVKENRDSSSLLEEVAPFISRSFNLDTFLVKNGSVVYKIRNSQKDILHSANNIHLYFTRVKVDSIVKKQKLFVEDIRLSMNNYAFYKDNSIELHLSSLTASVSDSLLDLRGIKFNSLINDTLYANASLIRGRGVNYLRILDDKKATFSDFSISNPDIKIYSSRTQPKRNKDNPEKAFFQKLMGPLADLSLNANKFIIVNGKFESKIVSGRSNIFQKAERVNLIIDGVKVDSASLVKFDVYDRFKLDVSNYLIKLNNSNFKIAAGNISADSRNRQLLISKITINQIHSLGTHQKTYFNNNIVSAKAQNFDYDRFFKTQQVHAGSFVVQDMDLLIFYDDTKKSPPDSGTSPQSIIRKIPFYLKIDSGKILNSKIVFKDKESGYENIARLSFDRLDINIQNFTNDQLSVTEINPVRFKGSTYINNQGLFTVNMTLPSMRKRFDATISGVIDTLSADSFNDFFAFSDIRILRGKIQGGNFDMNIQNSSMTGNLKFVYEDLKIDVVKKGDTRKSRIKSTIGNFIIKDSNPVKEDIEPEIVPLCGKKLEEDSFLDFVWSGVSDGIIDTVTKNSLYSKFVKRY